MSHPHVGGLVIALFAVVALLLFLGQITWWGALILAGLIGVPAFLVARQVYRALRSPAAVGPEALPGRRATVVGGPDRGSYFVRVEGELWRAESPDDLTVGERVYVLDVEENYLIVCRLPPELTSRV